MASRKVIVFGPTGGVGSSAARTAAQLGAHVVLAMRDTSKPVPGLDAAQEKQGGFERVAADLTKPDTVRAAVSKTGAEYAFAYLAWGTDDNMKATFQAMKDSGIRQVVFLSSFTVESTVDRKAIPPAEVIPYKHAQGELAIEDAAFPDGYVALRPGSFVTNLRRFIPGFKSGTISIHEPKVLVDHIVQEDIGRIGGTILAKGPQDDEQAIYILGPKLYSLWDTVETIAKSTDQNPTLKQASDDEARKTYIAQGAPPAVVEYMMKSAVPPSREGALEVYGHPIKAEWLTNVEKYTGKKATTFEEWLEKNKAMFTS